jgi:N-acetylneuraminic acid mutarotase
VNVKGNFYLVGGRQISPVEVFDPKTDTWSQMAPPPIEMHHFQALVYHNEVYVVMGMTGGYPHEKPLDHIYIFNPAANSWRTGAEIPADRRRGAGGAVIYQDKFYITCGITDGHWTGSVDWLDQYDPKTGEWKKLNDAPVARDHFRAVTVGDKLYCIAGVQSNAMQKKLLDKTIDEVDVYDFKTGIWSVAAAKLPTPRAGVATVAISNDILVVGGESLAQKTSHNIVEVFNLKTGEFTTLPPLVEGRHAGAALYFDKKIYAVAGVGNSGGSPLLTSLECFAKQ